jgi:hypothetical protein
MSVEENNISIKSSSDRSFGVVFTIVFVILGTYPLLNSGAVIWWCLLLASLLLLITLIRPSLLKHPNHWWFKFGIFLGSIIAPVVMALVYITTVVPIGLIMRMLGKDLLHIKIDHNAESYWVERDTPPQPMKNQF